MSTQLNVRIPKSTGKQIDDLIEWTGMTQTQLVIQAVDRLHQEQKREQDKERITSMETQRKWVDEGSHYTYPVEYSSQKDAAYAAQRLQDQLKIFAETLMEEDEGRKIWRVITRNDVLTPSNWRE